MYKCGCFIFCSVHFLVAAAAAEFEYLNRGELNSLCESVLKQMYTLGLAIKCIHLLSAKMSAVDVYTRSIYKALTRQEKNKNTHTRKISLGKYIHTNVNQLKGKKQHIYKTLKYHSKKNETENGNVCNYSKVCVH